MIACCFVLSQGRAFVLLLVSGSHTPPSVFVDWQIIALEPETGETRWVVHEKSPTLTGFHSNGVICDCPPPFFDARCVSACAIDRPAGSRRGKRRV